MKNKKENPSFSKVKDSKKTSRRLFGYFKVRLPLLVIIIAFAIAGQVFTILGPKIMSGAINEELRDGALSYIGSYIENNMSKFTKILLKLKHK